MELKDVDASTEDAFLRCLHLEAPAEPETLALRRRWYDRFKERGLRAKVLVDGDGNAVALGQYVPIEISPFIGEGLAAILCMWVHGYKHRIGNQRGRGYGRLLLEGMEAEIARDGYAGIAAWGMDFPYWNPVSWYLARGYKRADQRGLEALVWKPLRDGAVAPKFIRGPETVPAPTDRPGVRMYLNAWCGGGCHIAHLARCAARQLGDEIEYVEIDVDDKAAMLEHGVDFGLFVNGKPYRPFEEPWPLERLVADLKGSMKGRGADSG